MDDQFNFHATVPNINFPSSLLTMYILLMCSVFTGSYKDILGGEGPTPVLKKFMGVMSYQIIMY